MGVVFVVVVIGLRWVADVIVVVIVVFAWIGFGCFICSFVVGEAPAVEILVVVFIGF